ncbi:MAG: hypothetical protein WCD79_09655 [Chthoniobacteraceae bacterium]
MKIALPFLFLVVISLNACTTLANRRDLYSPDRAQGPNTDAYNKMTMETITTTPHTRTLSH